MKNGNKKLAGEWLTRAQSDLRYAEAGEKETGEHHVTCFLCHQAAEKLLKGLVVSDGGTPQKTHNLNLLLSQVAPVYPSVSEISKDVRKLDKFYIPARYPGGAIYKFAPEDSKFALSTTKRLLEIALAETAYSDNK